MDQSDDMAGLLHGGARFRSGGESVASVFPSKDLCSRVLAHVWVELGRPRRVDRLVDDATSRALGTVRRFGLHVPAAVDDAVAAAAWTFDLDRRTYERLERAT